MGGDTETSGARGGQHQGAGHALGQVRAWDNNPATELSLVRPGKLNNSYWENRVRAETVTGSGLPPRTPPPRRRLVEIGSDSG